MKKVLITGGAGFIAHHLIYYILKKTNWEIISLDRLDYSGNLNRLDNILSTLPEKDRARLKSWPIINLDIITLSAINMQIDQIIKNRIRKK